MCTLPRAEDDHGLLTGGNQPPSPGVTCVPFMPIYSCSLCYALPHPSQLVAPFASSAYSCWTRPVPIQAVPAGAQKNHVMLSVL